METTTLNIEHFELWMADLESGRYRQADGQLMGPWVGADESDDGEVGYCCLGVGCLRLDQLPPDSPLRTEWRSLTLAPPEFIKWLGLPLIRYVSDEEDEDCPKWVPATWEEVGYGSFDIGIGDPDQDVVESAANLNDNGKPFPEIAKWLREHRDELRAWTTM